MLEQLTSEKNFKKKCSLNDDIFDFDKYLNKIVSKMRTR